jgi:hypothetical protein
MTWTKSLKLTMQSTVLLSLYYMQQIHIKKLDINNCVKNNIDTPKLGKFKVMQLKKHFLKCAPNSSLQELKCNRVKMVDEYC